MKRDDPRGRRDPVMGDLLRKTVSVPPLGRQRHFIKFKWSVRKRRISGLNTPNIREG